jgi:hypothetical protein
MSRGRVIPSAAEREGSPSQERWRSVASVLMIFLLVCACRRSEQNALDVVHQAIDDARTKPRVEIQIRLAGSDPPSPADLQLQRAMEDRIEREHIGRVISTGSGPGSMSLEIEVDETVISIGKLRALLHSAGVLNRSTVKIVQP